MVALATSTDCRTWTSRPATVAPSCFQPSGLVNEAPPIGPLAGAMNGCPGTVFSAAKGFASAAGAGGAGGAASLTASRGSSRVSVRSPSGVWQVSSSPSRSHGTRCSPFDRRMRPTFISQDPRSPLTSPEPSASSFMTSLVPSGAAPTQVPGTRVRSSCSSPTFGRHPATSSAASSHLIAVSSFRHHHGVVDREAIAGGRALAPDDEDDVGPVRLLDGAGDLELDPPAAGQRDVDAVVVEELVRAAALANAHHHRARLRHVALGPHPDARAVDRSLR